MRYLNFETFRLLYINFIQQNNLVDFQFIFLYYGLLLMIFCTIKFLTKNCYFVVLYTKLFFAVEDTLAEIPKTGKSFK